MKVMIRRTCGCGRYAGLIPCSGLLDLIYIIPTDILYSYRVVALLKFSRTDFVLYVVIHFSARRLKLILI